jgi:transposase
MKTKLKHPVISEKTPRRKFDQSFKQESVDLWVSSGKSAQVIAQELGIHHERLYTWRRLLAPAAPGGKGAAGAKSNAEELAAENAALRRENDHLRQQRDILKKTLGILSEPPRNATGASKP